MKGVGIGWGQRKEGRVVFDIVIELQNGGPTDSNLKQILLLLILSLHWDSLVAFQSLLCQVLWYVVTIPWYIQEHELTFFSFSSF